VNIVVATTMADELGYEFAHAYRQAGGPEPSAVIVLPDRADLSHPAWAIPWVAYKLFGWRGTARVVYGKLQGVRQRWPADLVSTPDRLQLWESLRTDADAERLRALAPDVLVSIGVPTILPPRILAVPRLAAINVHNGALPKYRGHFATFWEVRNGEGNGGVSIHVLEKQVDSGAVVASARLPVREYASFLDLLLAKKRTGGKLLAELLAGWQVNPPSFPLANGRNGGKAYYPWPTVRDINAFRYQVPLP
jgi:hypothetical protein